MSKISNPWKLVISFLITAAAAAIGSLATGRSVETWYAHLNPTILTPPNWVFGPVWTVLYILMAVSAYLVWKKGWDNPKVKQRLVLYVEQLVLNAMWSVVFFGQHQIALALFTVVVLWFTILVTTVAFYKISKIAALLLVPYLLWVGFASILNLFIWMANR